MRGGEKDRAGRWGIWQLWRTPRSSEPEASGAAEPRDSKLPEGRNRLHNASLGQDPWGQTVSLLLPSHPEFKIERRFREVVFGSRQLTHHEFQNLSPSGTQKMICSPQTVTRALGFAKSHYLTEMGREMPANCYKI